MSKWLKLSVVSGVACCLLGIGVITLGIMMGGGRQVGRALKHMDVWNGYTGHYAEEPSTDIMPGNSDGQSSGSVSGSTDGQSSDIMPGDSGSQSSGIMSDNSGSQSSGVMSDNSGGRSSGSVSDSPDGQPSDSMPGSLDLPLASIDHYENIRSIKLEVKENRVEIRETADLEAGTVAVTGGDGGVSYQVRQVGDRLQITDPRWSGKGQQLENIILYVPKEFRFTEVKVENHSGSFQAERIYAEELSLEVSGGDSTVLGGSIRKLDAECNAGSIKCQAMSEEEVSAECKAGDIYLMLEGAVEDYDYKLECHMGKIMLEGESPLEFGGLNDERKIDYGTGRNVRLECNEGAITVGYQEPVL